MLQGERGARLFFKFAMLFAAAIGLAIFAIGMLSGGDRPSTVDQHGNRVAEQKEEKSPLQPIGLGILAGSVVGIFLLKKSRAKGTLTVDEKGVYVHFKDKKQEAAWEEVSLVSWGSRTDDPKYRAKMARAGSTEEKVGSFAADALIKMASDIWVFTISTTQGQTIVLEGVDFVDAASAKSALQEAFTSRGIDGAA